MKSFFWGALGAFCVLGIAFSFVLFVKASEIHDKTERHMAFTDGFLCAHDKHAFAFDGESDQWCNEEQQ